MSPFTTSPPLSVDPDPRHHDNNSRYSMRLLFTSVEHNASLYCIRERDQFSERPNIYVKVIQTPSSPRPDCVVVIDTGTGLFQPPSCLSAGHSHAEIHASPALTAPQPCLATFLESTVNPFHSAPYVILLTHSHYDHILGLHEFLHLRSTNSLTLNIIVSGADRSIYTPYTNLQRNSLCAYLGIDAPDLENAGMGVLRTVFNGQMVVYRAHGNDGKAGGEWKGTGIVAWWIPGHTRDGLGWVDRHFGLVGIGDLCYERFVGWNSDAEGNESDHRNGSSGKDESWDLKNGQAVVFVRDSNLVNWTSSMKLLLRLARKENHRLRLKEGSGNGKLNEECAETIEQDGKGEEFNMDLNSDVDEVEDCLIIHKVKKMPRARLCAGHQTFASDAEYVLLDMLEFMERVRKDQVPRRKIHDDLEDAGDVWLWDDDLDRAKTNKKIAGDSDWELVDMIRKDERKRHVFSVRAPWNVIHPTSSTKHSLANGVSPSEFV